MEEISFNLPDGNPAKILNNYFNKYREDPVLLKLEEITNIFAEKYDYNTLYPKKNIPYELYGGWRTENLRKDLLRDKMSTHNYNIILQEPVEKLVSLISQNLIFTHNEYEKFN